MNIELMATQPVVTSDDLFKGLENHIVIVNNLSDERTQRLRIVFTNGNELSVIQGEYSYGGSAGLFEVAQLNQEDINPIGYVTLEQLQAIIKHEASTTEDLEDWYYENY